MPSPFPGMNPLLQLPGLWQSFHAMLIAKAVEALNAQVAPAFVARAETRVLSLFELSERERQVLGIPDVIVRQGASWGGGTGGGTGGATATLEPPVEVTLEDVEAERQNYIVLREPRRHTVVTVIEVVSPTNKVAGAGRRRYAAKRAECFEAGVNFVEIDLVRGGRRLDVAGRPASDYCALVARAERLPTIGLWPFNLRDPLPTIPVPLRPGTPDARLDLPAVFDAAYAAGVFGADLSADDVDELDPPLRGDDAAWAKQILAEAV